MAKMYYTLAVLPNSEGNQWSPQFGDYDRGTVWQEQQDTKSDWPKGSKFKILRTKGGQSAINAAIDELNRKRMAETTQREGFTKEDLERHEAHNNAVAQDARRRRGRTRLAHGPSAGGGSPCADDDKPNGEET